MRTKLKPIYASTELLSKAARWVFEDDFAVEWPDADLPYGEMRFVITGMVDGRLRRVAYTERNDRIRIISARKATRHEQREYYRSQTAR